MKNETSIAIQQTSFAISNSRCPQCAKLGKDTRGNNLVNYSDNHSFCFACGYLYNPVSNRVPSVTQQHTILNKPVQLPRDISIDYPSSAIELVFSYGLTIEDLHNHNFLWSEYFQRLIYPVWQGENVIFWTGRYFGPDVKQSKWINRGSPKDIVHCINRQANSIVIVEDIISAIKILKTDIGLGVLVLFNSHNPVSKLISIGKNKQYFLWLDNDKFRESIFFAREAVGRGLDIKTITSERDPKDEGYNSIRKILNG